MKSGTPLPWRAVPRTNRRGQELTPAIVGRLPWSETKEGPIAIASAISNAETNANAAYIAHAANAYPKLVEQLRALANAKPHEEGDDYGTDDVAIHQGHARALLQSLGESA